MPTRIMIFCLQMPDVGSDHFCLLMTKITFFSVNITKTSRTYAAKKSYDLLKKHIQIAP